MATAKFFKNEIWFLKCELFRIKWCDVRHIMNVMSGNREFDVYDFWINIDKKYYK